MRTRRALPWAATFVAATAFAAPALPPESDVWHEIRTPHFTVLSDADPRAAAEIARELETLRAVLTGLGAGLLVDTAKPVHVYAFRNTRRFDPYAGDLARGGKDLAGYHASGLDRSVIAIDLGAVGEPMHTAHHEYLHEVMNNTFPGVPLWLNEGMAEYYSTFHATPRGAEIGRPVVDHVEYLRTMPLLPLKSLFAVGVDDPAYNEGSKAGVFYAESWALVHYLMTEKGERRRGFLRYLSRLAAGEEAELGGDLDALEKELRAYVGQSRFAYSVFAPDDAAPPVIPPPRRLGRAETLSRLGWLLAYGEETTDENARAHFEAALREEPGLADARTGIGYLELRASHDEAAAASLERAVAAAPDDPGIALFAGLAILGRETSRTPPSGVLPKAPPAEVLRARSLLERALLADPGSTLAMRAYGLTYAFADEDPSRGIAALRAVLDRSPGETDVAYNLVFLLCRAGDRASARTVFARYVEPSNDAEMVPSAADALLRFDYEDAMALLDAKRYDEGLAALRATRDRARDPRRREWIAAELARAEGFVTDSRAIERYNRGVELLNAGKVAEAKAEFEAVAAGPAPEDLRKAAREVLAKIRAR